MIRVSEVKAAKQRRRYCVEKFGPGVLLVRFERNFIPGHPATYDLRLLKAYPPDTSLGRALRQASG